LLQLEIPIWPIFSLRITDYISEDQEIKLKIKREGVKSDVCETVCLGRRVGGNEKFNDNTLHLDSSTAECRVIYLNGASDTRF
jgi:hypothetical protein